MWRLSMMSIKNFSLPPDAADHSSPTSVLIDVQQDANTLWPGIIITLGFFYGTGKLLGNPHSQSDTIWLLLFILATCRSLIHDSIVWTLPTSSYLYVLGTIVVQAGAANLSPKPRKTHRPNGVYRGDSFLEPMIFPCRTTHTRMFPTKHSFSYSYLLVGVPVDWSGTAGTLLSAGSSTEGRTWFSVNEQDYLARAKSLTGLQGKLEDYLTSQGVPSNRYRYAYLVTAPRFLGFSFNPVSFWYLYDHSRKLSAMILEVNNTFDERRMYLLEHASEDHQASKAAFSNEWIKDFHVSPFNGRDGSYSLTAEDVSNTDQQNKVNNNIVLRDDAGRAKIVARVFSTEAGRNPSKMSTLEVSAFLLRWWWVGFMTNPRILKEARVLWVKKLQVFYRPEVYKTSIGRNETAEEANLELYFRSFLTDLIRFSDDHLSISYVPAAGPQRGKTIELYSENGSHNTAECKRLDMTVLTPAFYGECVRAWSIEQAFTRFCFSPKEGEAMLFVSDHGSLSSVLQEWASSNQPLPETVDTDLCGWMVSQLRKRTLTLFDETWGKVRGRKVKLPPRSEFDHYVHLYHSRADYKAYLQYTTRQLLADRIALGFCSFLSTYRVLASSPVL